MAKPVDNTSAETLHAVERFISSITKDGSFEMDANGSVESMVRVYVKSYIMQYLSEGHDAIGQHETEAEEHEAASTWMNYEEKVWGRILFNEDCFLSYQVFIESFSGGAHSNKSYDNGVFNLATLEQIALTDLFSEVSMNEVNEMAHHKLMVQYGCNTNEELSEKGLFLSPNEIELNDNFYINKQGITWTYNPYEIAPYSVGEVQICLTWDEVRPLLISDSPLIDFATQNSTNS